MFLNQMAPFAIALASCLVLGGASAPADIQVYTNVGLNDMVVTENILFQSPAVCVEDCVLHCSHQNFCVAVTFHQGTCRGHDFLVTSSAASTASPSAQCFAKKGALPIGGWRYSSCTNDSECTETRNAECFKSKCLCTPGFFYSVSTKTCANTCNDLQSAYTLYPGSGIYGNNLAAFYNSSVADCEDRCNANPRCLNFELRKDDQCDLQSITPIMATFQWNTDDDELWAYFYQRDCA